MEIRLATVKDAEAISALNVDVQKIHADALPHIFKYPSSASFSASFIAERLADPDNYFFIGHLNNENIGYVYAQIVRRPENAFRYPMKYILIDQISIKPVYQGKGYGERLIQEVRTLAKDNGIDTIALNVWSFNEKARAFFARQGFATFNERMWLHL